MKSNPISKNALFSTTALALLALSSGCGSGSSVSSFLSTVNVNTSEKNNDVWASISAQLNLDGFELAAINLPIVDPKNTSIEYGQIALAPALCSTTSSTCVSTAELTISLNLTTVTNVDSTSNLLPNGTEIPLSGLSSASTLALAIGTTGGKVYIDLSNNVAVLGVAFPFSGLNNVGAYVPGIDIFDALTFSDVTAYIGVFAGSANDTTGLALFLDLSKVIYGDNSSSTGSAGSSNARSEAISSHALTSSLSAPSSGGSSAVKLKASQASTYQEYELLYQMQKLGSQHTSLNLSH